MSLVVAAARGKKKKGKELMEEKRGEGKRGLAKLFESPHEVPPPPTVVTVVELPDPDPAASHDHPTTDEFMSALGVHMVGEVLARLPVKALVRFMCISKKYHYMISKKCHDMISDAAFKRWYRRRRLCLNSPPLAAGLFYQAYDNVGGGGHFLEDDDIPTFSLRLIRSSAAHMNGEDDDDLYYDGSSGGDAAVVEMRVNYFTDQPVLVLGSCNGLLLLTRTGHQSRKYYICNPVTREWVTLPPPPGKVYRNCSAMLYIPSQEEEEEEEEKKVVEGGGPRHYKVILLSSTVRSVGINSHTVEAVIFSSETGEWMEHRIQCPVSRVPCHSIALEGALYHLNPAGVVGHAGTVVYLAKDNCMHHLALPPESGFNERKCLGMSRGSLHYAGIRWGDDCCRIWVLLPQGGGGGGEWSLKHVVNLPSCVRGYYDPLVENPGISTRVWRSVEPLGFHPTQPHLLFLKMVSGGESPDMVVSCDTRRGNRFEWVCFHKSCPEQIGRTSFFPYVSPAWPINLH